MWEWLESPQAWYWPQPSGVEERSFWAQAFSLESRVRASNTCTAPTFPIADSSHVCAFCRSCFSAFPEPGGTNRIPRLGGLRELRATGMSCPVCSFFWHVICASRGEHPIEGRSSFIVRVRIPKQRNVDKNPLVDISLEVHTAKRHISWHDTWKWVLAFYPDSNKISNRAIWGQRWPIDLNMRAPLLRQWLNECRKNHRHCSHIVMPGYPSRLLLISSQSRLWRSSSDTNAFSIKLVNTNNIATPYEYACVSHCWGHGSPLSTTSKNIDAFKKEIPFSEMPKTFLDAVTVAQSVDLRYLWIDSLCIMQDSKEDWESESRKMGQIYENAVLTIAASSATDSSGGCHLTMERSLSLYIKQTHHATDSDSAMLQLPGTIRSVIASPRAIYFSPLNQRGWVLQESTLSRRIIYFTDKQMYWQCRSVVDSEDGTLGTSMEHDDGPLTNQGRLNPNAILEVDHARLWWSWAMDYSRRSFTFPTDRLYACAGITQFYKELTKSDEVVLGLLRSRLQKNLLWQVEGGTGRRTQSPTRLPSWTWLSRDAPLIDIDILIFGDNHSAVAEVISVDLVWSGRELISPLESAVIKLSGRMITMRVGMRNNADMMGTPAELIPPTTTNSSNLGRVEAIIEYSGGVFDDDIPVKGAEVLCFEMLASFKPYVTFQQQRFLILMPVNVEESIYERIGAGYTRYKWDRNLEEAETIFDGVDAQIVTLI